MNRKKYLVVIGGATATGKTALAIEVAKHFRTEIVSADSRQFFREMNIGTAKPTEAELQAVKHHFVDAIGIHEEYNVGDYERDALALLDDLFTRHSVVVLAGGSGLYIRALCEGLDAFPAVPQTIRRELELVFQKQGIAALQQELLSKDPVHYLQVDLNNPQRLIRALSVCRATGLPFSGFLGNKKAARDFTPIYVLLAVERSLLYEKINRRVDSMMAQGLLEEAEKLFPFRHLNALQTVGYQELFAYLEGETTLEAAVEKIKQNTRRYAKRQETWFRKNDLWQMFSSTDFEGVLQLIREKMKA
jgi:tRNA dimethylallyltransferase